VIPYGRQNINDQDIEAVVEILRSDFITQGPLVGQFENAIAAYCKAKHAVAANSATSALHIACLALGLGPSDWLWTSPVTFVASANCGLYCGAKVDFVDIDPRTYNMSAEALHAKLAQAEKQGTLPKVVIPVHLAGQPCEMARIHELSKKYGFRIIEDASHAIGGRYKDKPIGNCEFSDITVFSFHPVKIITTAEGGMAMTNDTELAGTMRRLCSHGTTREPSLMTHAPDGPWYYQQIGLGFNYRMTDIQAALGLSQMKRLDGFITRRHELARKYDQSLAGLPLTIPWQHPDSHSALHLYIIRLKPDEIKMTHRQVFESLRDSGIGVNLHYIPVYRQPFYARMGFSKSDFPEAEKYYAQAISIPMFPDLGSEDQWKVVKSIQMALQL
jgi:UDP-4-amino-4,6-dideoxy-N-acetyl-beta-L-altrosamine transaminase